MVVSDSVISLKDPGYLQPTGVSPINQRKELRCQRRHIHYHISRQIDMEKLAMHSFIEMCLVRYLKEQIMNLKLESSIIFIKPSVSRILNLVLRSMSV